MVRRKTERAEDELDGAISNHFCAMGFATADAYRAWCAANGFSRKLRKHPNVRTRELQVRQAAELRAQLAERRRTSGRPIDAILAICERRVDEREISKPHLRRLYRGLHQVRRAPQERHLDRKLLAAALDHLCASRAKFFDDGEAISSLGAAPGNSYAEALVAVVANKAFWRRPIEAWRPRSHNARRQFASLLRHLFVAYDMPEFFDAAWFAGMDETAAAHRAWYVRVGRGENIRHCDLPIPYTKRMAHHFLAAPANATIVQALRWGQVLGLGGDERLARTLFATRLGESFDHDDFWQTVVRWIIQHPMLDRAMIGPVVDYLAHQRFALRMELGEGGRLVETSPVEPNLTMKGRSPTSLLAQVHAWHRRLAHDNSQQVREWPASGIAAFEFLEGTRESGTAKVWSIRELLGSKALAAEGRRMRHCVASYGWSCARGVCSIWTIECDSKDGRDKCLTVEIRNDTRQIVQARGFANRLPTQREREILHRWAGAAQLSIGRYV